MTDELDGDDEIRGHILSRREAVVLIGATGLAIVSGCSRNAGGAASAGDNTPDVASATPRATGTQQPNCVVRPELTEGPYFVDKQLNRSDIRTDSADGSVKPGVPLRINFVVSTIAQSACTPLAGAMVDVWHCDHLGEYSGVSDPGFQTQSRSFLRGHQITDAAGSARFDTVYPGWYRGRAVHIHFKVRSNASEGRAAEFTSQLFFDEAITDRVHAQTPYSAKARRDRLNSNDGIFRQAGAQLLLPVTATASGGYTGDFSIALA